MTKEEKYNQLEKVLGECFDSELLPELEFNWRAFYNEPEKYNGSVVVAMVNQWIDENSGWKHSGPDYDYDPGYDDSDRNCASCPPSECTGHCFSCAYRSY